MTFIRDAVTKNPKRTENDAKMYQMESQVSQLNDLLSRPVVARIISTKYLTSGSIR
jgi:uncharacterized membrane protein